MKRVIWSLCLWLGFSAHFAFAGNWPQFRGPHFNGSSDEVNLPSTWSLTENVVWAAELPGASSATPVVWENHVFVSSTDAERDMLMAICLDRETGQVLWQKDIAEGIRRDSRSNFAAPTPATDGDIVAFFYSSGQLVVFDFDGNELWRLNIQDDYGEFAFQWTFSTSPLLIDGKLVMQVLQRDTDVRGRGYTDRPNESYLLALDARTGQELFRHIRPSKAVAESREAFTTPIAHDRDGRRELIVIGGDAVSGHDPSTGEERWRWGTWNPTRIGHWRHVPSPVVGDGIVLVCAPKKDPVYALRLGGVGPLDDSALAWVSRDQKEISSDVPTPAFADGDFFILSDVRKSLARVDPQSGQVKWSVRTPGSAKFEASPLVADGKIYIVNFSGMVAVFDAKTGEQLSTIAMDEPRDDPVRASVVAAQGQLFVRTTNRLFCIAN